MTDEQMAQILVQHIGQFEFYDTVDTKERIFRLENGETYRVPMEQLALLYYPVDILKYLINLMGTKQVEAAKAYLLDADNKPNTKRIIEINKELDILRGIVPTPKGYTIDMRRAKELMAELKRLLQSA